MEELELMNELKKKTLETIIDKHGPGVGELSRSKVDIWTIRCILYEEARKIAEREIKKECERKMEEFT